MRFFLFLFFRLLRLLFLYWGNICHFFLFLNRFLLDFRWFLFGFWSFFIEPVVDTIEYDLSEILEIDRYITFLIGWFSEFLSFNKAIDVFINSIKERFHLRVGPKVKGELDDLFHFGDVESEDVMFLDALLCKFLVHFFFYEILIGFKVDQQALFQLLGGHGVK